MSFQIGNRDDLLKLPDEKIIEIAVAARDAGEMDRFVEAVGVFIWSRLPLVKGLVALKVGDREDQENVVQEVLVSTLESAPKIRGSHAGEFVGWLKTITRCRIADFHARQAQVREREMSVHATRDEDGDWFLEIADLSDTHGAIGAADLVARTLDKRSPLHRRVVELRMDGYRSREIAELLEDESGMTATNVDQIFSRFRRELSDELGGVNG